MSNQKADDMYVVLDAYVRDRDPELLFGQPALALTEALRAAELPAFTPTALGRSSCPAAHALGWLHYLRFSVELSVDGLPDLARAILLFEFNHEEADLLPEALRPLFGSDVYEQTRIADALLDHHLASGDPYEISAAITLLERAYTLLAGDGTDCDACQAQLGIAYSLRFNISRARSDLDASVYRSEQAVATTPHHDVVRTQLVLMRNFLDRFGFTGECADLDASIAHGEHGLAVMAADNPRRSLLLAQLGHTHHTRFDHSDDMMHLDLSIDCYTRAVTACPADDQAGRADHLDTLARALLLRFDRVRAVADLHAAVAHAESALSCCPDDVERARIRTDLATAYLRRFRIAAAAADLQLAIAHGERAQADGATDEHLLNMLGTAYDLRFARGGETTDSDSALVCFTRALAAATSGAGRVTYLTNLGHARRLRFERFGAVEDIDRAVECGVDAVAVDSSDGPDRAHAHSALMASRLARYDRLGAPADLEAALADGQRAVASCPSHHPELAMYLSNLAVGHGARYTHGGELADLHTELELIERSLAATADGDPGVADRLANLSCCHKSLFERSGSAADLDAAIEHGERGIAATPADHPHRAMFLSNLSCSYRDRYERLPAGRQADADAAITYARDAVAATPVGHWRRIDHLMNLATAHGAVFEQGGRNPDDLTAAIGLFEQSLAEAPVGHPGRAAVVGNLAGAYALRHPAGDPDAAPAAARLRAYAGDVAGVVPAVRVRVACTLAAALRAMGQTRDAAQAYRAAVELLPTVTPRSLVRTDQEYHVHRHRGVVTEAIAAQLDVGDPGGAVEVAEAGRGILLAAALDTRTDTAELEALAPDLAGGFHTLRTALTTVPDEPSGARRREMAQQWDRLLARIRERPGLGRFLEPPRLAELQQAAGNGTIVLLNLAGSRSDAVLLGARDVRAIDLPGLCRSDLDDHLHDLLRVTDADSWAGSLAQARALPGILEWLWTSIVGPVLDALGHTAAPSDDRPWPRIWWLPAGPLGLLPLHAAGLPGGPAALDRVVSSYVPTIRALLHSHRRPQSQTREQLVVAVPEVADGPQLPGTTAEAYALHTREPDSTLLTDTATTAGVAAALGRANWAHIACHARIDIADPARSGLALLDGTLTINQIGALDLPAELAYLSACATAQSRGHDPGESAHLASTFQLAGFRHVVATLWPVDDGVAAAAARRFYELTPAGPSAAFAPYALHRIAREVRAEHPDRPDLWAPFIHSGP